MLSFMVTSVSYVVTEESWGSVFSAEKATATVPTSHSLRIENLFCMDEAVTRCASPFNIFNRGRVDMLRSTKFPGKPHYVQRSRVEPF